MGQIQFTESTPPRPFIGGGGGGGVLRGSEPWGGVWTMSDRQLRGAEEIAHLILSWYPNLGKEAQREVPRVLAEIRKPPAATVKRGRAQRAARELAELIVPHLSRNGQADALEREINHYQGNSWSFDVEFRRTPGDRKERLLHEILTNVKKVPVSRTFWNWLG